MFVWSEFLFDDSPEVTLTGSHHLFMHSLTSGGRNVPPYPARLRRHLSPAKIA